MSALRRRANRMGTFLFVDGEKFDVSNIVHESTERIPDQVTADTRRLLWATGSLYPSLASIEQATSGRDEENPATREGRYRSSSSGSSSSASSSSRYSVSYASSFYSSNSTVSSSSSTSSSSGSSYAATAEGDHESLTSSLSISATLEDETGMAMRNEVPMPFAAEMTPGEHEGRVQTPGAERVGESSYSEKAIAALHEDGPGSDSGSSSMNWKPCWKHPKSARKLNNMEQLQMSRSSMAQSEEQSSVLSGPSYNSGDTNDATQGCEDDDASWSSSHSNKVKEPRSEDTPLVQVPDNVHSRPTPGAFATTSNRQLKPFPPAWVDQNQDAESKARKKQPEASSMRSIQPESSSMRSIQPEASSISSIQLDASFMPSIQPEASSRSFTMESLSFQGEEQVDNIDKHIMRSQVDVEIAPGKYMLLRGSAETVEAVENEKASMVSCFACEAALWCVPDADLVLCPDCRILSPLASKQSSQPGVGGVGLGMKVDCESTS